MTGISEAFYDRAPSTHLRALLAPGGFLAPLRARRTLGRIELEVHLGRGDEVLLYCGLTRLVKCARTVRGKVWVKSHKTYAEQKCASLLIRPSRANVRHYNPRPPRLPEAIDLERIFERHLLPMSV